VSVESPFCKVVKNQTPWQGEFLLKGNKMLENRNVTQENDVNLLGFRQNLLMNRGLHGPSYAWTEPSICTSPEAAVESPAGRLLNSNFMAGSF